MQNQPLPAKCPDCGFTVLTDRYPKCERCDRQLPVGMVMSKSELEGVFARERQAREDAAQKAYRKELDKPKIGTTGLPMSDLPRGDWMDIDF
jgi:hypothetical protein